MKWFYADAGKQVGPVEDAEFDRLVGDGVVRGDTLVWHDGMPAWQALGVVRGWVSAGAAAPPVTAAGTLGLVHYGGFWIRFLARLIDGLILGVVNLVIRIPLAILLGIGGVGGGFNRPGPGVVFFPAVMGMVGLSVILSVAVGVAYEAYFVSTRGGTLGKLVLGLKIVRADGSGVPVGLAVGRYFAQWISGAILLIGYIMAGFDEQKRALHDRICETRVIYSR